MPTRRAMLCAAVAISLGIIPESAIAATGISQTKDKKIRIDLKVNKTLKKIGGAVLVNLSDGSTVAVVRAALGLKGLRAVNLTCPHNGVTVMEQDNKWICPAHGSQFSLTGSLINGPANRALYKYPVVATATTAIIG